MNGINSNTEYGFWKLASLDLAEGSAGLAELPSGDESANYSRATGYNVPLSPIRCFDPCNCGWLAVFAVDESDFSVDIYESEAG
jgi:hypothetical protein